MKKRGVIVSSGIALLAILGLGMVFVANASPYVTIPQLSESQGKEVHVSGTMDHASLRQNLSKGEATFKITDQGHDLNVLYRGKPQPNLANATTVVVIGKMEGDQFVAHDMLLKCPSKYESTKSPLGTKDSSGYGS